MSSPELESFKMNEDDIEDIYNPLRRKKKPSKNYNIYGVWADSSDEESNRYRKGKLLKDYTMPVNFISGGVKVGAKGSKKEEEEHENNISQDSDDEQEVKPVQVHRKVKTAGVFIAKSGEFGDWERHNKGIGSKLMKMMGHKHGKGLGKRSQGITKPIEAFLRKGRGAVGMYGSEAHVEDDAAQPAKKKLDEDDEEERMFKKKMQRWKKGEATSKTTFVTADELLDSKEAKSKLSEKLTRPNDLSKVKIIDMTGKEKRVLSGYHALSNKKVDEEEVVIVERHFDHPELVHNLELLVNMSEEDIIQNTKHLNYEEDSLLNLQMELVRLDEVCKQDEVAITRLQSIISIIDQISEVVSQSTPDTEMASFEKAFTLIEKLKAEYMEEFYMHDLGEEIVQCMQPMIVSLYKSWKPLEKPEHGLDVMTRLRAAFTASSQVFTAARGDQREAFDRLMWEVVVPCLRDSIRGWNVRWPNEMLVLIEKWVLLLQQSVLSALMDQFVFSKLQMEISAWDPLTDPVPVHSWVQPWLFLMKDRITSLYPTIRQKLGNALSKWHPSDPSAKLILEPWVNVFEHNQLDVFLVKFILPKLAFCLQQMDINPGNQSLEAWRWVMEWLDLMPQMHMASLVADHFLPRWFNVLSSWASSHQASPQEITEWYFGWKQRMPARLANDPMIKKCLREGMLLIEQKMLGSPRSSEQHLPYSRNNISEFIEARRAEDDTDERSLRFMNIKERLDHACQQRGILFVPVSNRIHDGKQVYKVGRNTLVFFEKRIVFFFEDSRWKPTSNIDNLLDRFQ